MCIYFPSFLAHQHQDKNKHKPAGIAAISASIH
jgi:hypothetical protein